MVVGPALLVVFSLACFPNGALPLPQTQAAPATGAATAGAGNSDEAERLTRQTITLYNRGEYAEALPIAERALEMRRKLAGKDDPLLAAALFNVASLEYALGQYPKAVPLYEECLKVYEKSLGPDDPKLCSALEQLAWASYATGRPLNTEKLIRRSIEIKERAFGPDSGEVASSVHLLGRYYEKISNYQPAMSQYQRALAIMQQAKGEDSPEVATELDRCACIYTQTGDAEHADEYRKRAGKIESDLNPDRSHLVVGQVVTGKATHREEPVYPKPAEQSHITGSVVVEVVIDETGKVIHAKQTCGPDIFSEVSVGAARKWVFAPTTLNGSRVKVVGTITFNFKM
ncbi:MAG TPA: TonB family protein [Blastocatellia bacterium]